MTEQIIPVIIALILVVIAWKVLKGIAKTIAMIAILAAVAIYVFGVGA